MGRRQRLKGLTEKPFKVETLKPLERVGPIDLLVLKYIYRALIACEWNRTHAADKLCMPLRTLRTYVNILRDLGYEIKDPHKRDWSVWGD